MSEIILDDIQKIFFIGIGGTSMSGLALMSQANGFEVSGSDMRPCGYTDKLEINNIKVYIGHDASNIPCDADLVVYSAAIRDTNPEIQQAKKLNIPLMERSYFLGMLSKLYPDTIAISGTHGKTTTSSLVSLMLLNAKLDPSVSIGGTLEQIGGNSRVGESRYFVIEACEFVDSFLHTSHNIGTILNIDSDHLDYFTGGITQIEESFEKFAKIIPRYGILLANGDDIHVKKILPHIKSKVQTFGIGKTNFWNASNIRYDNHGKPTYDVYRKGEYYGTFKLNIPGEHNVMNSLSVIAIGDYLRIELKIIQETFLEFNGAKRRFEFKGEEGGIKVYEDYAHHPKELQVTIDACKNYKHNKLWVIFQPHTYSRTYYLFDEFVDATKSADEVIFNDIYSDREDNAWNIYSEDLASKVNEKFGIPACVISEFEDIENYICDNAVPGDFVLVAGSQSINQVAKGIITKLKRRSL